MAKDLTADRCVVLVNTKYRQLNLNFTDINYE